MNELIKSETEVVAAFKDYTAELVQYNNDYERLIAIPEVEITDEVSKEARQLRLTIKKLKSPITKTHKDLKEPVREYIQNLDKTKKQIIDTIKEKEAKLEAIEKFAENKRIAERAALGDSRFEQMQKAGTLIEFDKFTLAGMDDAAFAVLLANTESTTKSRKLDELEVTRRNEVAPFVDYMNDGFAYDYRNMSAKKFEELKNKLVSAKIENERIIKLERERLNIILPLKSYWSMSEYNVKDMKESDFDVLVAELKGKKKSAADKVAAIQSRRDVLLSFGPLCDISKIDVAGLSDNEFNDLVSSLDEKRAEKERKDSRARRYDEVAKFIKEGTDKWDAILNYDDNQFDELIHCARNNKYDAEQAEIKRIAKLEDDAKKLRALEAEKKAEALKAELEKKEESKKSDKQKMADFVKKLESLEVPEMQDDTMQLIAANVENSLSKFIKYIKERI